MQKFSTSTYFKALSLVALALYFTNCAPKGPNPEVQLKAHCLKSMDPKADFIATADKLSENAKVRIVTADYSETTLRDDQPIEDTTIDLDVFSEKPAKESKEEVANSLLPKKFCGTHQLKLPDGTIARINSSSDNHIEASWTTMTKSKKDDSKKLESMNSITYRYVIDPDTKLEHLEITKLSLIEDRKKISKKNIYIGERLSDKVKINASVLQALSTKVSPGLITSVIQMDKNEKDSLPEVQQAKNQLNQKLTMTKNDKLTFTPLQRDYLQNQIDQLQDATDPDVLDIDPKTVLNVEPNNIIRLQNFIKKYTENESHKIKIKAKTVDVDEAEVRTGNPMADNSLYKINSDDVETAAQTDLQAVEND